MTLHPTPASDPESPARLSGSSRVSPRPAEVVRFLAGLGSLFVISTVVFLAVWAAVLPLLFHWSPVAILSGSMTPAIDVGDVVVAYPHDGRALGPGTVAVFWDPGRASLVTHRIVGINPDGTYVTKGDANPQVDSTPLAPEAVVGVGRLLVPLVGFPQVWLAGGQMGALVAATFGWLLALWTSRWGLRTQFDPWASGRLGDRPAPVRSGRGRHAQPRRPKPARAWMVAAIVAGLSLLGALRADVLPGMGALSAVTSNSGNTLAAAATFCSSPGSQTMPATADSTIKEDDANKNFGGDSRLVVRPRDGSDPKRNRALVRFNLPPLPAGCSVTGATLRLNAAEANTSRTIAVYRVTSSWTENGVTWNNQPTFAGTAVTAPAGTGWRTWNVLAHVTAMYQGVNHGFIVMDANELSGSGQKQEYHSRESGSNRPELIVTWG